MKTKFILPLVLFLAFSIHLTNVRQNALNSQKIKNLEIELRQEITKELSWEFDRRIQQIVKEEVSRGLETHMAQAEEKNAAATAPVKKISLSDTSRDSHTEPLQEAARRMVRESIENELKERIDDKSLDTYVAGEDIIPGLQIADGFNKELRVQPEIILAQADTAAEPATETEVPEETAAASASTEKEENAQSDSTPASDLPDKAEKAKEALAVQASQQRPESIERTLVQKGSMLLPKGTFQFEPSMTWAHFSSNRINIRGFSILPILVVGDISTETVKRDVFIQNFGLKYGALRNLQTEVRIPVRSEYDRITDTNQKESTRHTTGIGDIEFGVSRQIGWEHGLVPDLIASLNVKTPTGKSPYNRTIALGTGHWALRGSLVAAKSSDPTVIFGSFSYTYSFPETPTNYGRIEPGASLGYSLGTAIALSYQTAINFSFDHSVTLKTIKDGQTVAGSFLNVANFRAGFNWALNERSSIDFAVGIGLTNDSPDVTVEFRFPYTF